MSVSPQLAREPERTIYDYRWAWEGENEEVRQLDGAIVHEMLVRWAGVNGLVVNIDLDPADPDGNLDRLIAELGTDDRRFLWVIGPSTRPADLAQRLEARGMIVGVAWDGMVLENIPDELPTNPEVTVEPLSEANVEEYAVINSEGAPPEVAAERLAAARRFLAMSEQEVQIFVGRLNGKAAGAVIMHVEPNGVAYLRNAYTLPELRGKGVYTALVGHRLRLAREAGCTSAAVQANQQTSSPILKKRGFVPVYQIYGYAFPTEETQDGGW